LYSYIVKSGDVLWNTLKSRLRMIKNKFCKRIAKQENTSFSALIRKLLGEQIKEHQNSQLKSAAQALLMDYMTAEDLLAFTSLDGEDFHARGRNLAN